jgi:hypothetical protein
MRTSFSTAANTSRPPDALGDKLGRFLDEDVAQAVVAVFVQQDFDVSRTMRASPPSTARC